MAKKNLGKAESERQLIHGKRNFSLYLSTEQLGESAKAIVRVHMNKSGKMERLDIIGQQDEIVRVVKGVAAAWELGDHISESLIIEPHRSQKKAKRKGK